MAEKPGNQIAHCDDAANAGGIVLCGGMSRRMGLPKWSLPFGAQPMLCRVIDTLSRAVGGPIVVVAAGGQDISELPADIEIVRDEHEALGPLAGLAAGLRRLQHRVPVAYATSCDVPLLSVAFVREMLSRIGNSEVAIPQQGDYYHPMAAVYRTILADKATELVEAERLRPVYLMEQAETVVVPVDTLQVVDPELHSLRNLNTPADYFSALETAGLPRPAGLFAGE